MSLERIDHIDVAVKRLISIFRDAPSITKILTAYSEQNNDQEDLLFKILNDLDIDKAQDDGLDSLGEIIGLPRPLLGAFLNPVFVYRNDGVPDITGNDGAYGEGYYTNADDPDASSTIPMNDEDYRRLLRAKIHLNWYGGTIDNVREAIRLICSNNDNLKVTYEIAKDSNGDPIPLVAKFKILKPLTPVELVVFQGSYPTPRSTPTPSILTIWDKFIYPKNMGVWYIIEGIRAVQFTYSEDGVTYGAPVGKNVDGIPFETGGGYSDGTIEQDADAGVYWDGDE